MNQKNILQLFFIIVSIFTASMSFSKDYVIYSIAQEFPMGVPGEVLKKNFYVNMGANQGIKEGTTLDVFRMISVLDPYESKKRYSHKIKIGELSVLHAEESSSIGVLKKTMDSTEDPLFEIGKLMIGDHVNVSVKE
jgi:hypothetical protein